MFGEPPPELAALAPSAKRERGGTFACDELKCEYSATRAGRLNRHKRTHSGEQPHACDEPDCEYRAIDSSHLKTHKRTHIGERPHACDEPDCEYRAADAE
jgi:uncharacterized Zn-finger protein